MTLERLICASLLGLLTAAMPVISHAYSPGNHERSIVEGAALCKSRHGTTVSADDLRNMIEGVIEPDAPSPSSLQMFKQRFEPGSYGKQRNVSTIRIAAQSLHGSPNPTRPVYTSSKADRAAFAKTIPVPGSELMADRFDLDVYAYDTNQSVRNKLLINASQFLCVSFAHKDDAQAARKFGNMMHMIADTYSASHVQRSAPRGPGRTCGTEKIEWHFSMDLVSWKQHRAADTNNTDWRFRCLVDHTSDLMKLWLRSRKTVARQGGRTAKLKSVNREVRRTLKMLCNRVLREDASVLAKPSGGAAAGYSSASGTDNWKVFSKQPRDRAIQPVGLTSREEAHAFYKSVDKKLQRRGGPARFSYPYRDMADLCRALGSPGPLPAPLQCKAREIDWAMKDSDRVRTMWLPPRPVVNAVTDSVDRAPKLGHFLLATVLSNPFYAIS